AKQQQPWFEPPYPGAGNRLVDWLWGLSFILPAVVVSGLTVIAGFGALASSSIPTPRGMGLFDTIGVAASVIIPIPSVQAMLTVINPNRWGIREAQPVAHHPRAMTRALGSITSIVLYRPIAVLAVCGALIVLAVAGLSMLRVNTNYLKIFPA